MVAAEITLIVAEKPSMGRDIARTLGARTRRDGFIAGPEIWVTWCIGHLVELCEPHEYDPKWKSWSPALLPILPSRFQLRPSRTGAKQLRCVQRLMRAPEVATVVNACDAGREGELIFRLVYELSGCRKPVQRLWISSLTQQAIRRGMARLRAGSDLDALADAARCRSEADWLVGINATRALTALARRGHSRTQLMSVGRVQTPTLALIVRREQEIEAFVSEPYWEVLATFRQDATPRGDETAASTAASTVALGSQPDRYQGLWHRPDKAAPAPAVADQATVHRPDKAAPVKATADHTTADTGPAPAPAGTAPAPAGDSRKPDRDKARDKQWRTRLATRAEAEAIANEVAGQPGQVTRVEHKTVRERPPLLFDLTTLQKTANRRFGMSAERTLAAAQTLYETHKAITYPRTDARYLTSDLAAELPALLETLARPPYQDLAAQAQSRGVPRTGRMINDAEVGDHHAIIPTPTRIDVQRLSNEEQRIYDLVVRRFLAGFLADAVFAKTRIETTVSGHRFISDGRVCLEPGWQVAEPPPKARAAEPPLPAVRQGAAVHTAAAEVRNGETQPPKRYTEASLLAAMEHAGRDLDEEALRRALKDSGLGTPATRAAIIETLLARRYVRRQGRTLHPTATGRTLIATIPVADLLSAELTGTWEQKLADVASGRGSRPQFMGEICAFTTRIVEAIARTEPPASAPSTSSDEPVLGSCPVCRRPVTEGFKTYQCAGGKECSFVIFKRIAGRTVSPALVQVLLGRGRSQLLKGFRSKRGKRFAAALVLGADGKVNLEFTNHNTTRTSAQTGGQPNGRSKNRSPRRSKNRTPTRRTAAPGSPEPERAAEPASAAPPTGPAAEQTAAATQSTSVPGSVSKPGPQWGAQPAAQPAAQPEAAAKSAAEPAPGMASRRPRCPACRRGRIIAGRRGWGCSRWREACNFVVWYLYDQVRIPEEEAERLFRRGQTRLLDGLSPHGRARLVLDCEVRGNVRVELGKQAQRAAQRNA